MTVYKKAFWSANTKSLLTFAVIFTLPTLLFKLLDDGLAGFLFFSFIIIISIRVFHVVLNPESIVLSNDAIMFKNSKILWSSIREIKFDRQIYKPIIYGWEGAGFLDVFIPNQIIIINTDSQEKIKIYPRFYEDNIMLRKEIENIAHQRNIKCIVRDRGLS